MIERRKILIGGGLAIAGVTAGYLGMRQMGSMAQYNDAVAATRAALSEQPAIADFIRYATLAASGHNTQPWRFRASAQKIEILPDLSRRTPVVDPDDHHLFVSLGCAAENLSIAASARGRPGSVNVNAAGDTSVDVVLDQGAPLRSALFDAIPLRQSTRADYDGRQVSTSDLKALAAASTIPGVDLVLITERPMIERVRDLVVAGNMTQIADPAFVTELKKWLRFSPHTAIESGDGLFSAASGSPALPDWLGKLGFNWVFTPRAENDKYIKQIASSSGIAVFIAEKDDREHWILAGRACQRFALHATALGLKTAYINQPVEVANLRPQLANLVGLPGRRPDILMRFGYGPTLPYSARRPVSAVLA
ncbi:MAG: nitroreductase family protein [Hyphomicrobiaceae bacterium]